jgi:hypothetical protein
MPSALLYRDADGNEGEIALGEVESTISGHAAVKQVDGSFWIEPRGGETLLNNRPVVAPLELFHNDVIQCGALWLRYIERGLGIPRRRPPEEPAKPQVSQFQPPQLHVSSHVEWTPPRALTGAVVTQPSGPDASPRGGTKG